MLDQPFDWTEIIADITKRPYIAFGISAYLLMIPLVITSNATMMRVMGIYWKKLHLLIYLVTTLGLLHFFLLVKANTREPWIYMTIFGVLIILRVALSGKKIHQEKNCSRESSKGNWS